jgi:hypothetical protein
MTDHKLTLVRGGLSYPGGASPPGSPPSGGGRRGSGRRRRRGNPLNELLWFAVNKIYYPNRASSIDDVARRMTRLSQRVMGRHINVTPQIASYLVFDCRRRRSLYNWTIWQAQKGAEGFERGFVPVLYQRHSDDTSIYLPYDLADAIFYIAGTISATGTVASMLENIAESAAIMANMLEDGQIPNASGRLTPVMMRDFARACRDTAVRARNIARTAAAI